LQSSSRRKFGLAKVIVASIQTQSNQDQNPSKIVIFSLMWKHPVLIQNQLFLYRNMDK